MLSISNCFLEEYFPSRFFKSVLASNRNFPLGITFVQICMQLENFTFTPFTADLGWWSALAEALAPDLTVAHLEQTPTVSCFCFNKREYLCNILEALWCTLTRHRGPHLQLFVLNIALTGGTGFTVSENVVFGPI